MGALRLLWTTPEMALLRASPMALKWWLRPALNSAWCSAWTAPELALLECAWHGTWSSPGTALQTAPPMTPVMAPGLAPEDGDDAWRLEMAPENGAAVVRLKMALLLRAFFRPPDWRQNGAPHRHRSSRRCKEGTVSSFYAPRLVFILFIFYFFIFYSF